MERTGQTTNLFCAMDHVHTGMETLWNAWSEREQVDFERPLRLAVQDVEARKAGNPELAVSVSYQFGRLDGCTEVFERLYRAEERVKAVGDAVVDESDLQTKKIRRILRTLYREGEMRHGELADAVDSPCNSLTGIMKKVLRSGAVESVRSGRNTRYRLTEAGRQFCRQNLAEGDEYLDRIKETISGEMEKAARLLAGSGVQPAHPQVGDRLTVKIDDEIYNGVEFTTYVSGIGISSCAEFRNEMNRGKQNELRPAMQVQAACMV